jgi:hypothetical protein
MIPKLNVVYVIGVELIAIAQTFRNSLCKDYAGSFVQRPIGLPTSARSPRVVVNISVGQRVLQLRRFSVPFNIRTVKARQPLDSRDEFDGHGRSLTAANAQTRNSSAQPACFKRT